MFEYDLMNEADFPSINIASGVEGDEVTEGIPDPYMDQSPRIEVPEMVYTQDPPYDTSVVEIGEKVLTRNAEVKSVAVLARAAARCVTGRRPATRQCPYVRREEED